MAKYQLTLSESQAEVLVSALDLYSRIGMGQLENILEHPDLKRRVLSSEYVGTWYGIHSKDIHESNRIAWDIQQVIRHRISWDKAGNPPQRDWKTMLGVNYDSPHKSSIEELPTITLLD